jgi:hypothetical protein
MLLTSDMPDSAKYLIHDCDGHVLPYVVSFDTETEQIELHVRIPGDKPGLLMQSVVSGDGTAASAPILLKFKLPGAYALRDGEPI